MTGELRQKITIQSFTQTSDGQGGFYENPSTVKTAFAKVERMSGKRQVEYQQLYEGEIYEVTMRYNTASTIKQGDNRLIYEGKNLTIHEEAQVATTLRRKEGDRYIKFICSAKSA